MSKIAERMRYVLLESETVAVRFFFGFVSLGYAIFIPHVQDHFEYKVSLMLFPSWMWAIGFALSGLALLYGVITCRYSRLLFTFEGVLGAFSWVALGITSSMSQGTVGATAFASVIALWIMVRYPKWK